MQQIQAEQIELEEVNIEIEIQVDDDIEITLPKKGSACTLEYFQEREAEILVAYKKNELKRQLILKDMKINPQLYFNFGFTVDDYLVFMLKQTLMRAERQVIEQEYTKFLEKKNFKLKDEKLL